MIEVVPPNFQLSGLLVNPLVVPLAGGRSTLVSFKYHSKFREFNAYTLEELFRPKAADGSDLVPKGMVARNKKLADRLETKKKEQDAS
jgi:hypothetical protein